MLDNNSTELENVVEKLLISLVYSTTKKRR